jgi:23S rRNA U2552 (ribose-2'-O)-methylase RlmE/FtsJ
MGKNAIPGASLRVWKNYFSNASIYGADIDKEILFEEDSITTFYCDQTDRQSLKNMWNIIGETKFDLIIDDGLHTFQAGINTFLESINHLSDIGLYVIEDVKSSDLRIYSDFFLNINIPVEFIVFHCTNKINHDDNLIVISALDVAASHGTNKISNEY